MKSEYTVFIRKVLHSNATILVSLDKLSNDKESIDRELGLISSLSNADILAPFATYLYSNFSGKLFIIIIKKTLFIDIFIYSNIVVDNKLHHHHHHHHHHNNQIIEMLM